LPFWIVLGFLGLAVLGVAGYILWEAYNVPLRIYLARYHLKQRRVLRLAYRIKRLRKDQKELESELRSYLQEYQEVTQQLSKRLERLERRKKNSEQQIDDEI
jgi:biopolymer transport protein ExbB/TolQ